MLLSLNETGANLGAGTCTLSVSTRRSSAARPPASGGIKGVLWHQGEYNSNNNSNPAPEPHGSRLQGLVAKIEAMRK